MDEKQQILEKIFPVAVLMAMSRAAEYSIPQFLMSEGLVPIFSYPFRVGRESRVKLIDGRVERIERVKFKDVDPNNDLYLVDEGHLLNISREHFQIEKNSDKYYVYDRGSACGTLVGDKVVGGSDTDGSIEIKDGDIITVGTKQSPYLFKFVLLDEFEIRSREE